MTTIDLGYRPRAWQAECHRTRARFTVLALHRRAGKTELAIAELIDKALRCTLSQAMFIYVAPLLKQAKTNAWDRLKARVEPLVNAGLASVNEGELTIIFIANGAKVRLFGADNPDSMRGMRLDGAVIDEVAQVKPETWEEVIQPALADRLGWALFIGTPKGVNLFSKLFFRKAPNWHSRAYTVYDTDALDPEEVARYRRDASEATFAREYLCDFTAAGNDQLLSLIDIMDASNRHVQPADYEYAPRILGVDPARFGDDRSVIYPRQGLWAGEPDVFHGMDNMQLAAKVAEKMVEWEADAVFIDAGNGGGVIDRLRQLGHDVIEVNFGGKPSEPRFVNKRAEMWWNMRDWILAGGRIPPLQSLHQDLAAPTYKFDAQDRIVLESKDDIKARALPSPDLGDALALTFAYTVAKKRPSWAQSPKRAEYDPLSVADRYAQPSGERRGY